MISCPECSSCNIARSEIQEIELVNEDTDYDEYEFELIVDNQLPMKHVYICMSCIDVFTYDNNGE